MSGRKEIAFLVGSECRLEIMRELAATPGRPTELAERCSCARETIQRALAGFVDRGWVEKGETQYRLTLSGDIVLEQYEMLAETVTAVSRLDGFLAHVGEVVSGLDPRLLAELTVTAASAERPHAPIERFISLLSGESPEVYRGITPIVSQVFNQASDTAIGPDTTVELIIDESVLEASRDKFPRALGRAHELDQMSIYLAPFDVDFGLAILDDHACLGAYDGNGNLVATVDGADERFLAWAKGVFKEHRSRSERITSVTDESVEVTK